MVNTLCNRKKPHTFSRSQRSPTADQSFENASSSYRRNLSPRMVDSTLSPWSTLSIELVYRILDHAQVFDILGSIYGVFVRWDAIIDTYHPFQVKMSCSFSGKSFVSSLSSIPTFCSYQPYAQNYPIFMTSKEEFDISKRRLLNHFYNVIISIIFQIVNTLNLERDNIGDQGAERLASGLKHNCVRWTIH